MKFKMFMLVALVAAVIGCKSTSFQVIKADGTSFKAKDSRLFLATKAKIDVEYSTNGTFRAKADATSNPAADAISAAAEGAVRGAMSFK
jgi:hypothetical protein